MSTAAENEPLLSAHGVRLVREGQVILDDVSLAAVPGRLLAVIGPNGAGKSSLMEVLSGWWAADAGKVLLRGRSIGSYGAGERARLCAVMRQEAARPAGLDVLEVVELGCLCHGGGETEAKEIAWEVLGRMELAALAARSCTSLSGGEWQRVAFARTVAQISGGEQRPCALLLDEPVSSLDPAHQHRLLGEARGLARRGHAVLTVLHDLNLTMEYADEVALMRGGRLRACGPADEIMLPEVLSEVYACPVELLEDAERGLRALLSRPGV
jgi:iron complex transport system ATP-binding protein